MELSIPNCVVASDGGHQVFDTSITAGEIARLLRAQLLAYDPNRQRGINTVTGKIIFDKDKADRWSEELLADTAIFGQLTWNFRPEEASTRFIPDDGNPLVGTVVVADGSGWLCDSHHRHEAIRMADASIASGSRFDRNRRFSVRIWCVSADFENDIFHAMNQGGKPADATRGKYLAPKGTGQMLARALVYGSPHLTDENVEVNKNTVSAKNPRLLSFNTLSLAFESDWGDIPLTDHAKVSAWLISYWDQLVRALPDLGRLELPARRKSREESLVGWAVAVQGYIKLARKFYDGGVHLSALNGLTDPVFFDRNNSLWQEKGIVVPTVTQKGEHRLTARNSHQSRRAMANALIEKLGMAETLGIEEIPVAA